MNIGIPNQPGAQAHQGIAPLKTAPNIQRHASMGDVSETQSVLPGALTALRKVAAEETGIRPEMIEKGSAFLADPNYPPLDSINGIASIFIDDFFLKNLDP